MRLFEIASPHTEERFMHLLRYSTESSIAEQPQLYMPRPANMRSEGSAPMPDPKQVFDPMPGDRKPTVGFWTSSAWKEDDGWESDWSQWVKSEMPQWFSKDGILFYPKPGARVLTLNDDNDFKEIYDLYVDLTHAKHDDVPRDMGYMRIHNNFPWPWVAQHFDAVHTDNPSRLGLFSGTWDVESTVWFKMDKLQNRGKVPISEVGLRDPGFDTRIQILPVDDEWEDEDEYEDEINWDDYEQ